MSENTKIEWADHTFNAWEGCQKVGPGCDNCYAENRNARFAGGVAANWGPGAPRRRTSPANWRKPLQWEAQADTFYAQHGRRQRVFCSSLADVFDNAVDPEWRQDLANLILQTPNLDWLLLTKRIGNAGAMLGEMFLDGPPPNVRIGTTICNQPEADRDIPKLVALGLPNFLSMEPLLGPVDLRSLPMGEGEINCLKPDLWETEIESWRGTSDDWQADFEDWYDISIADAVGPMHARIDWVIVGGESGPNARPMHPDWARSLRDQCTAAGVPFFFKQWGEWADERHAVLDQPIPSPLRRFVARLALDGTVYPVSGPGPSSYRGIYRIGKKAAGRVLDGLEHNGFPESPC